MIIDVLRIATQEQWGFFHIFAKLTGWNTETNDFDFDYSGKNRIFQDHHLMLSSQGTNESASNGLYAIKIRFDTHGIEMSEIESLAKHAKKLQAKLDKWNKEFGYSESYGDHMARFAMALGIKDFAIHQHGQWKLRDIPSARWYVKEKELEWSTYNQIKSEPQAATALGLN